MEEWRIHPIYSRYEVSSEGRIRNLESGELLSIRNRYRNSSQRDYAVVTVTHEDPITGHIRRMSTGVASMVYSAFYGPYRRRLQRVWHIDNDPMNNRLENLTLIRRMSDLDPEDEDVEAY